VVHRRIVNAIQDNFDEEEKEKPKDQASRWVRVSLETQRPDVSESSIRAQVDLGEQDEAWMRQVVERAQSGFIETGAPEALDQVEDEVVPPGGNVADDLQRATYKYGTVMRYSMETRQLILSRVFEQAPSHARELRQLGNSSCTGFWRLLDFSCAASEKEKNLI
jgi:hypothetical protein